MILITIYSNICDIFQQQFLNCRVTMATFYDDIVVGIVSLFNSSMNCDIQENVALFHNINDFSKWSHRNSFQFICLIKKVYCSKQIKASFWTNRKYPKNIYSHISVYGLTTLNKPKSGQVSTNKVIMTQTIVNFSVLTSVELKTNINKL